jgi:hypothetical protein
VDDAGALHCKFDNGRTLGVIPDVDKFHKIQDEQTGKITETKDIKESEEILMQYKIYLKHIDKLLCICYDLI